MIEAEEEHCSSATLSARANHHPMHLHHNDGCYYLGANKLLVSASHLVGSLPGPRASSDDSLAASLDPNIRATR